MNPSGMKRSGLKFGEAPTKKHATLEDEQIQKFLEKQLDKKTTLSLELGRNAKFTKPTLMKDDTQLKAGKKSLSQFLSLTQHEQEIVVLREHGLSDEEIALKLQKESTNKVSSTIIDEQIKRINEKIKTHEGNLKKTESFTDAVSVSRREFEVNEAMYNGSQSIQLNHLINLNKKEYPANDPVIATLKEYEEAKQRNQKETNLDESDDSDDNAFIGPLISNVNERVQPLSTEIIFANRISLHEIHDLEKFKNYKAGIPSKNLYIKNLSKTVKEKHLASLFCRYYKKDEADVQYRLFTGRMHGQAFVTFTDEKSAMEALLLCNGYKLFGKPMIIEYGKAKK